MDLKPCPFCGYTDVEVEGDENSDNWIVYCENDDCHCIVNTKYGRATKNQAIKDWNTRLGK